MQYSNYAFISYKREDEKWAKWLQKKLEAYKLPSVIRNGHPELAQNLRPIFRDSTDLAGTVLKDSLHKELVQSRYLIIVCSPNATKSEWVNKEAATFIEDGRTADIIPFIVGGKPHASDPAEECFPVALQELSGESELLGIDVQDQGGNKAFLKLVATMLGVKFDLLWRRHRRSQARRRALIIAAASVLALLGVFIWDYNRSTYEYYADYVDRYGVPEGVVPLTSAQVAHRNESYRFQYRRIPFGQPASYSWRLVKVMHINSAGHPKDLANSVLTDRTPIMELEYNGKTGIISRINYCNVKGKVLLRHVLSERAGVTAAVADFLDAQEQRGSGYAGSSLSGMFVSQFALNQAKSNIVRFVYERDADGHIVKKTYHSNNDPQLSRSAAPDAEGIFGQVFTLDSLGRQIRVDYIDAEGNRICNYRGIAGKAYEYDAMGNIVRSETFDLSGEPVANEAFWAICTATADEWGNILSTTLFDASGNPCTDKNGINGDRREYDSHGFITAYHFVDVKGHPTVSNLGFSRCEIRYDRRGNDIESKLFDNEGRPCMSSQGFCSYKRRLDRNGNVIKEEYYGTDGKPCLCVTAIAGFTARFDRNGNRVEVLSLGLDGKPVINNRGYARSITTYDADGRETGEAFFGVAGEPVLNMDGLSSWVGHFDDKGNLVGKEAFGTDGKPCVSVAGLSSMKAEYDEVGRVVEMKYYGADGLPCITNSNESGWTAEYDGMGNMTRRTSLGPDGKPCLNNYGYASRVTVFDSRGFVAEESFEDADGSPIISTYGFARVVYERNGMGRSTKETYYDTENRICNCVDGYAISVGQYDSKGNRTEEAYYDEKGDPCLRAGGFFRATAKYNDRGMKLEAACFGTDGKPCLGEGGYSAWKADYDERGNVIKQSLFGVDGKPCLCRSGYSIEELDYNDAGLLIRRSIHGVNGELVSHSVEKWSYIVFGHDSRGFVSSYLYYDANGEKCLNSQGYCKSLVVSNELGQNVEVSYYGLDDEPVEVRGFHRSETQYNELHHVIGKVFYNKDNQKIASQVPGYMVNRVTGISYEKGLPLNSVLLQWNSWKLGDSLEALEVERSKSLYGKKDLSFMTPEGKIFKISVERGLLGASFVNWSGDQEQIREWMKQLELFK